MIPNSHKKTILILLITIIAFAAIGFVMLSDNKTIQQFSNLTTGSVGEAVEAVAEDKPIFLSGSLEPKKVAPGDEVIVTVEIKDKHGIKNVLADMGGLATIELHPINKTIEQFNNSTIETWQGKWIAQGTGPQNYQTMVYATNTLGKQSSMSINWEDPTITDTFDNEDKIFSKTNITVSAGKVKLTLYETTTDFSSNADSYVNSAAATTNYGSATGLKIQFPASTSEGLVKFDLSSISGKNVTYAEICIYIYSQSLWYDNVRAFRITGDWAESTVTWNTKPSYAASATTSFVVLPVGAYRCGNITSDVQGWCNGTYTNYGTSLTYGGSGSGTRYVWFYSKEYTATNPYLRVTYNYYETSGNIVSTNLLIGQIVSSIDSFVYNLSAKPAGTGATVGFNQDGGSTWYNAAGSVGTETLVTGSNQTITLTSGWSGPNFYYKITFTSDGVDTPVLDDISVNYTSWQPRPPGVSPSGGGFLIF